MITWTIDFPDRLYSSRTGRDEEGNVYCEDASRERVECRRPDGSVGRGWTPEQALRDAVSREVQLVTSTDALAAELSSFDAHNLMPGEVLANIPALYSGEQTDNPIVWLKWFTADSGWTWYVTEFDGKDTCFGLVIGFERELGYFSLSEIQEARGPYGLRVERDLNFEPCLLSRLHHPGK